MMKEPALLKQQASELKLYGLLSNWHNLSQEQLAWLMVLLGAQRAQTAWP